MKRRIYLLVNKSFNVSATEATKKTKQQRIIMHILCKIEIMLSKPIIEKKTNKQDRLEKK